MNQLQWEVYMWKFLKEIAFARIRLLEPEARLRKPKMTASKVYRSPVGWQTGNDPTKARLGHPLSKETR